MNQDATDKIEMIKGSMRCFAFGLFSLLPVVGFLFAMVALWLSSCVRPHENQFWNPAKPYRICGITCAVIGAVAWSVVVTFIAIQIASKYISS